MCALKEKRQERYTPSSRVYREARDGAINLLKERKGTFTGRKHSEETKRKQSEALKGKAKSKKHCESISKALKGKVPWNKGKRKKLEV
jgi:hypothetical protein